MNVEKSSIHLLNYCFNGILVITSSKCDCLLTMFVTIEALFLHFCAFVTGTRCHLDDAAVYLMWVILL